MELYSKEALISALNVTVKSVAFLVGSPISNDINGKGVPSMSQMLNIIREVVLEKVPSESLNYDKIMEGKVGAKAYQSAMDWLQAYVNQDAVNVVVRKTVLRS